MNEMEDQLQRLTNAILDGKVEEARQSTYAALAKGSTTNEILDAMLDAVNIVVDLHEVGEYDQDRVNAAEAAVNSSLQVVEDRLAKAESRFDLKATVGAVGLKAGNLLALALSAALRSVGLRALSLGKTQTPLEILRNSEELRADLVLPLLSCEGIEQQLDAFTEAIERGGFKSKFKVIAVAPGLPDTLQPTLSVARNSGEALSRATEWALKQTHARRG